MGYAHPLLKPNKWGYQYARHVVEMILTVLVENVLVDVFAVMIAVALVQIVKLQVWHLTLR